MSLSKKLKAEVLEIIDEHKSDQSTLKKIKEAVLEDEPRPRTIASRYSSIKKIMREKGMKKELLSKVRPEEELTKKVIDENVKVRDSRAMTAVDKDVVDKILGYRKSKDLYEMAIYLLFTSGRRTRELFESSFTKAPKSKVRVDPVLKQKERNTFDFIPIQSAGMWMTAYKRFKREKKGLSYENFSRTLNRRVKKILGDKFHPHSLRGMYAVYMFNFKNKKDLPINPFIKQILGHQSLNSSMSYTNYKIGSGF